MTMAMATTASAAPINPLLPLNPPLSNVELASLHITNNFTRRPGYNNTINFTGGVFQTYSTLTGRDNNTHVPLGGNNAATPINFARQSTINIPANHGFWNASGRPGVGVDRAAAFQFRIRTRGFENIRLTAYIKSTGNGPDLFELAWATSPNGPFTAIPSSRTTNRRAPQPYRTNTYADFNWSQSNAWRNFTLPAAVNNLDVVYIRAFVAGNRAMPTTDGNTAINRISFVGNQISPSSVRFNMHTENQQAFNQLAGPGSSSVQNRNNFLVRNGTPTMQVTTTNSPRTATVTGRNGTSQGVRLQLFNLPNINTNYDYTFIITGHFHAVPENMQARLRFEGTNRTIALANVNPDGTFTIVTTVTGQQLASDASGGNTTSAQYSIGNTGTVNPNMTVTNVIVTRFRR